MRRKFENKSSFKDAKGSHKKSSGLTKGWVDEEIESDSEDSDMEESRKPRGGKSKSHQDEDDEDESQEEDDALETADQKRRRYDECFYSVRFFSVL